MLEKVHKSILVLEREIIKKIEYINVIKYMTCYKRYLSRIGMHILDGGPHVGGHGRLQEFEKRLLDIVSQIGDNGEKTDNHGDQCGEDAIGDGGSALEHNPLAQRLHEEAHHVIQRHLLKAWKRERLGPMDQLAEHRDPFHVLAPLVDLIAYLFKI